MITRIEIENFKSIASAKLDLEPVTVLIGPSGSGKTNIVHAIRFLRNVLLDEGKAVQEEGGWARILPVQHQDKPLRLAVSFALDETNYHYELVWKAMNLRQGAPHIERESFSVQGKVMYARDGGQWTTPPPILNPGSPAGNGRPLLGSFPMLSETVYAHAALTGIGVHNFRSDVLTAASSSSSQTLGNTEGFLDDSATHYRAILRDLARDLKIKDRRDAILAALQGLNRNIRSLTLDSMNANATATLARQAGELTLGFQLNQESDGLRRFLAHLLALYQPQTRLLHIFEEPENAIYQGALALLAEEFKRAPQEGRGQVLLTTHSERLLDSLPVEGIRAVHIDNFETHVGPISDAQRTAIAQHLMHGGDLLFTDPARIEGEAQ